MLTAFRPIDRNVPGFTLRYLPGWEIQECDEQHPDYGKVLTWVRTKKEALRIVETQRLPERVPSVKGVNDGD